MDTIKSSCCKNKMITPKRVSSSNSTMSFFSTILLILLPKCPLCMTAYMSAIVMFFDIDNSQLVPILLHAKPIMGVVILIMILMNRKDKRTLISLSIGGTALIFLILKTYYYTAILPDWLLYSAFIFAIWYNGNFQYFYRFIRFGKRKEATA